jgi:hypothetical protein
MLVNQGTGLPVRGASGNGTSRGDVSLFVVVDVGLDLFDGVVMVLALS